MFFVVSDEIIVLSLKSLGKKMAHSKNLRDPNIFSRTLKKVSLSLPKDESGMKKMFFPPKLFFSRARFCDWEKAFSLSLPFSLSLLSPSLFSTTR